jgi:four helix bundle protein
LISGWWFAPICTWEQIDERRKRRTKLFGLRIIKLVAALPRTAAGRTIGGQLIRAGTLVGANYRASCRARSRAEFIARLGIVEEEADESGYWLELIVDSGMMKLRLIQPLLSEADELVAIMVSSRVSAARNKERAKFTVSRNARLKPKIKNQKSQI